MYGQYGIRDASGFWGYRETAEITSNAYVIWSIIMSSCHTCPLEEMKLCRIAAVQDI
jgi:hypothetical protein